MDKKVLNDSKLFEKQEIKWFSINDMKKKIKQFRSFYQEIVYKILDNMDDIHNFIKKHNSKNNTTKKIVGGK
jgi:transcription termination factor NusB